MFNDLNITLLLNQKNFDHIPGRRFYYSPQTTWLTVIFLSASLLMNIYLLVASDLTVFWILSIAVFSYYLIKTLSKLLFKNPVLILDKNMLFYTKNEKWYDLLKCDVDERIDGRYNYYRTLFVTCEEEDDSFRENYWYIEYDDDLKRALKKFYR
ncbi:MAG: hypothetical protein JWO09_3785 [Bacteroidetes bacterium]|nr:hypothetical protein [Bacteroidota bacterium]